MIGRLSVVAVAIALAVAGCGGKEEDGGSAEAACGAPPAAMAGQPTLLPSGFPTPDGVTYTSEEQTGPSGVVHAYADGELESTYEAYRDALDGGGFSVTKSEKEEDDAEVNFEGGGSTGQVKLVQECRDRTTVTITSRPE
jgi:hypothetical protein